MSKNSIFTHFKPPYHPREKTKYHVPISSKNVKEIFTDCSDFEIREIWAGGDRSETVSVCWLDGVVSGTTVSEDVIKPLTNSLRTAKAKNARELISLLVAGGIYSYSVKEREKMDDVAFDLVHGFCVILFDCEGKAVAFETRTSNTRGISEPTIEKSVKGAKDAFVETLRINTSLVRRKLRDPELKIVQKTVGRKTSTQVAIFYLKGVANDDILREAEKRVDAIDIDGLTSAGSLEHYIVDAPYSPFPQLIHTERPDKFSSQLLDGRVGLMIDGIPVGFLLPATLAELMRVGEDRAQHFLTASMLMLLRWLSLILTIILPALLVAVAMYHQEMLPVKLLKSMIEAKQDVPFSVSVEVLSMLVAFELLQEAGVRLPNPIGDTVSIIGALIVGQSAVDAKVVSPIAVIVVATAGICGYTQPSQDVGAAARIVRILLVLLAIALGMYGLMLGVVILVWHLCTIESYGVSYVSPLSDEGFFGSLRAFVQRPVWRAKYRDPSLKTEDKRRQK